MQSAENGLRVLMVGPSTDVQGGIARVMQLMLAYCPSGVEYIVVPTVTAQTEISYLRGRSVRYYPLILRNLRHFLSALRVIHRYAEESRLDLAHIHFASRGSTFRKYWVVRALARDRVPMVLHAHGGEFNKFYQSLPKLLRDRILWMLNQSRGMIVLSSRWLAFYNQLLSDCPRPIWVMPNPVELPEHWCAGASDTLKLLFLGRMGDHKGTDRVLHALARLPAPLRSRVRLYMAGDGEVQAMRQLAAALGLQAQVDIRDWIEGEEKQRWLQETNAFILPSRAEGLPMAMLEAMAYGKALIVSPVGGIPEFVTDGQEGIFVPPEDIDAISCAIAELAQNPERRAQMGRAARTRVEPLDVRRYMERLKEIYVAISQQPMPQTSDEGR